MDTDGEKPAVSLLDILLVLVKRRRMVIAVTVAAAGLALAFAALTLALPAERNPLPNVYEGKALAMLQKDQSGDSSGLGGVAGISGLAALAGVSAAAATSQSSDLLLALVKQEAFQDELGKRMDFIAHYRLSESKTPLTATRKIISKRLKAEVESLSGILTLSYRDTDKTFATAVANAAIDLLQSRFTEVSLKLSTDKLSAIEASIDSTNDGLNAAQEKLTAFQIRYGFYDLQSSTSASLSLLGKAGEQLLALQEQYRVLSTYRSEGDPQLATLKKQIDDAKARIQELRSGSPDLAGITIPPDKLLEVATQYAILKNDLSIKQGVYASLRQQLETTRVEEISGSRVFVVIQRAEIPEVKAGPSRGLMVIVLTMVAFFLSVLAAFAAEYGSRVGEDPEEGPKLAQIKALLKPRRTRA